MPELPEVETIRRQLIKNLPLQIESDTQSAGLKKNVLKTKLPSLKKKILVKIDRKGKMLDFIFDDGSHLLSHLGMTGTWLMGKDVKLTKHSHLILSGANGKNKITLAYDDPRRFGKMYYLTPEKAVEKLNELGPDLLDPAFDVQYLKMVLQKFPERMLKVTLLDQKLFAGSGNYIASEICARAKILPTRKCKDLKEKEFSLLLKAVRAVIEPALELGGTTFQGGYRDSSGEFGAGKSQLVVFYQKICQMCKKNPVEKIILAQRGTYFCSRCQK
ncbi:MAG: Fpg/Nei family DNA glycosylase [Bdellovibrionaceae bacterium]|nr:Fpg/Nei family DNA glycosylase [Pseudobdellovibrionaceae bacterium]